MAEAVAFSRECSVADDSGNIKILEVCFYLPVFDEENGFYTTYANVECPFFQYNVRSFGTDAAQAFFALPYAVTSYLIGKRQFGYEVWWLEKGDLDYTNFWTYSK